jgi:hypothetical protein
MSVETPARGIHRLRHGDRMGERRLMFGSTRLPVQGSRRRL